MTSITPRKRYRIRLNEWASYVRWIEAESAERAIELAEEDFCENGDVNFSIWDASTDCEVLTEEPLPI